jgi:protein gp37
MAKNSKIQWTDVTWNPITGCSKISAGCDNCYAERMAARLKAMGSPKYRDGFKLALHRGLLGKPLKWKKPSLVFVNSMSDLFHRDVPIGFINEAFDAMRMADWHIFQILTKRIDRAASGDCGHLAWPNNVWIGATVENRDVIRRIDLLREIPAAVKFVSFEPLLGPLPRLDLKGIDWVIAGGESGPGARPMKGEWVAGIQKTCSDQGIPFFFKQWGGPNPKKKGRLLNGVEHSEMPRAFTAFLSKQRAYGSR